MVSYHTYAKASMISGLIAWGVQHQPELSMFATCVAITAGIISILKGIRGK